MTLTSQTVVKFSNEYYTLFDEFCFKAKNLYTVVLYRIRKIYFEKGTPLSYNSLDKILKQEQNIDYGDMPLASSAQWTLQTVFKNWKSFCTSLIKM